MITNLTNIYTSKLKLKFRIDNLEDLDNPLSEFIHPSEIVRLMGVPDVDGKFRFNVEVLRVTATEDSINAERNQHEI